MLCVCLTRLPSPPTLILQKNHPFVLPDDLKRFFTITNGLSVKWFASFRGHPTLIGHFVLNGVQELQKTRVEKFATLCRPADLHRLRHVSVEEGVTVFPLESSAAYGDVALVYFSAKPQVWFRDLRGHWSFLADNFTCYYRMMIAHLGLISWQTIFSDVGLDPFRKPWFYLFIPHRMAIDEHENAKIVKADRGSAHNKLGEVA
ncbi:hypothetical protein Poli38472_009109 [Pythium oligandrum]|uniref:Tubulin polyglutamylase complex subunit 2 n=1 Tax=Pythium oligandrum TaxID=41045 RepID=A0A8K1CK48_PYTOL|nr:hypothetical protein Poli38472_009109 [Pythium oligandrum]|eukprot:TMW64942.1 hypothetical protein Poli38472_009109 [Pythium oligandrum]